MAIYEVLLRFQDRDEIRLADTDGYRIGGEVTIARRSYIVVATGRPAWPGASTRFVLEPVDRRD